MNRNLQNILRKASWFFTGPWGMALIVVIILAIWIKKPFPKHKIDTPSIESVTAENVYFWEDSDNDGNSELYEFDNYQGQHAVINIYDKDRNFVEVINLSGSWIKEPVFLFDTSATDGIKDLFLFYLSRDDSLFVVKGNPLKFQSFIQKRKYICQLPKFNNNYDYDIHMIGLADNNGDMHNELLFGITAGFPRQPRAIYAWDIFNDSIYRSPESGANLSFSSGTYLTDLDGDGIDEIFYSTSATDNYNDSDSIDYSDQNCWLMTLGANLKYVYPPIEMGRAQTLCYSIPNISKERREILATRLNMKNIQEQSLFQIFEINGVQTNTITVTGMEYYYWYNPFLLNSRPCIYYANNTATLFKQLNNDLSEEAELGIDEKMTYYIFDPDYDGEEEILAYSYSRNSFCIIEQGLSEYSWHTFPVNLDVSKITHSNKFVNSKYNSTFIQSGSSFTEVVYGKNPLSPLNIPFYLILFFGCFLAFYLLQKIWEYRQQQRKAVVEAMQDLQLKTTMNQLNPHFLFNAINAVGNTVLEGNSDEAYEYFTRISDLIRTSMDQAFQTAKTLEEELKFVKQYLEIEAYRFPGMLSWEIEVDPAVDISILIPKMLIHIFVENSIKHGLSLNEQPGEIHIKVKNLYHAIMIEVTDNGKGIPDENKNKAQSGKGLEILDNYLKLFKKHYKREISFKIEHKKENGLIQGTQAILIIKN